MYANNIHLNKSTTLNNLTETINKINKLSTELEIYFTNYLTTKI